MELRLECTVDDDEDREPMKKIHDLVEKFLTTGSSMCVTEVVGEVNRLASPQYEEGFGPYVFLMRFWEVVMPLAWQIPHNHPSQARLAGLIMLLASDPKGVGEDAEDYYSRWRRLHGVDEILQDIWSEPRENMKPWDMRKDTPTMPQWVNINSFVARILGPVLNVSYRFPIWTMMLSLESFGGGSVAVREMRVLAAAQWFIHCSKPLLSFFKEQAGPDGKAKVFKSRYFEGREAGWSMNRWNFWKAKLEYASEDEDFSADVKTAARLAVAGMNDAEKCGR